MAKFSYTKTGKAIAANVKVCANCLKTPITESRTYCKKCQFNWQNQNIQLTLKFDYER